MRSISTLPKSANAFVRRPMRQRPLRVELEKTATRLSAATGPTASSGACAVAYAGVDDADEGAPNRCAPSAAAGRSRTSGSSSPIVLAR